MMYKEIKISDCSATSGLPVEEWRETLKEMREALAVFLSVGELVEMVGILADERTRSFIRYEPFVALDFKGILMKPKRRFKRKGFVLSLVNEYTHKYVDDYVVRDVQEPNEIHKPTEKKLEEWKTYLLAVDKIKREYVQSCMDKLEVFNEKLAELEKLEEEKGVKVQWYLDKKRVVLSMGNLRYTAEFERNGHIYEKIEVDYQINVNLDLFLKMADNKSVIPDKR